jgi:hydroxymethylpyrimidine kinase / phosphomethylpyrimidine kinase / thiamine-phosphate diphosphorylase
VRALAEMLVPRATVVTPNIPEAEVLSGSSIHTVDDMVAAGRAIVGCGARAALVKGGHSSGDTVVDVLVEGDRVECFEHARLATDHTHGTGCTLSSAIAALLACGWRLREAVAEARSFVRLAMRAGPAVGSGGHRPLDHGVVLKRDAERFEIVEALGEAFRALRAMGFAALIPEVQSNFAYALPWAETIEDVAAFPGRIVRVGTDIAAPAAPAFGASRHIARVVLTVMRRDPAYRACVNIRYAPDILARLRSAGFSVVSFDRREEPAEVKARESATLEWGTERALEGTEAIPDAVADAGDIGKEPMIRLLGRAPAEIVEKLRRIL